VELAEKCVADHNGDVGSLSALAPFLPKSTLDRLLRETLGGEDAAKESAQGKKYSFNDVVRIAPFVDRQLLDQMVRECYEENGDFIEIAKVAPFISKSVLDELVRKVYERHSNLKQMVRVAPFVSKDVLVELAEKCVADHNGDVGSLSAIAPFLPKSTLDRLLRETFGGSEE